MRTGKVLYIIQVVIFVKTMANDLPLLTFNSLYTLVREEKKTKDLCLLPERFYDSCKAFFEQKTKEISSLKDSAQAEKIKKEKITLSNAKKLLCELLVLRCVKVASMGIKNKTYKEEIVSIKGVLEEEKSLLNAVQLETDSLLAKLM